MREIKFRAWHKKKKKMYDVLSLSFCPSKHVGDKDRLVALNDFGCDISEVVVMQFTGLTDKSNIDICEGDFLFIEDTVGNNVTEPAEEFNHIVEVEFFDGCFGFEIADSGNLFSEKGLYTFYAMQEYIGFEDVEIIGNIYENKEYIKGGLNGKKKTN